MNPLLKIISLLLLVGMAGCASVPPHFPSRDHMQANAAIDRAFTAVTDHFWATGRWPQSLDQLGDPAILDFRGIPIQYNPASLTFSIPPWCSSDYSGVKQAWEDSRREANLPASPSQ